MVRAIGVSNFHVHQLEDLLANSEIVPMVDQVEYHPLLTQKNLHTYCKQYQIQLEARSPLMQVCFTTLFTISLFEKNIAQQN